jgi:predicted DNA binding CopG/RHH family protein
VANNVSFELDQANIEHIARGEASKSSLALFSAEGSGRMKKKLTVPKFKTEAEEAKWWDEHMDTIEKNLLDAIKMGGAKGGGQRQIVAERRESKNITIRIAEIDLALARKQAEEKGMPYQTYIKSILHEELLKRELRRGGGI